MTKKTAYMLAIDALNAMNTEDANAASEIITKEISRLNSVAIKATVKRASKAEAKANELAANITSVFEAHTDEAMSATDIVNYLNDTSITKSKVSYRLNDMAKNNIISKFIVSVKDTDGKNHRVTMYKLNLA